VRQDFKHYTSQQRTSHAARDILFPITHGLMPVITLYTFANLVLN
jgi:hypothetical protein